MHTRHCYAEQGGESDSPRQRLGERQALVVDVARHVVGADRVDGAVRQAFGDRQPVGIRAQRRRKLGVSAEIADRRLVQVEIGGCGVAGHADPVGLRASDQGDRLRRGDVAEMQPAAGELRQPEVARDQDRLGGGGYAGQSEPSGELAFGGDAARRQRRGPRDAA